MLVIGLGMGSYFFFKYAAVGTVRLLITDPPMYGSGAEGYDPSIQHIFVTFSMIDVHAAAAGSDSGWHPLTVGSKTIDLIKLLTVSDVIGTANLPTGKYNVIRMFATAARVMINDHNVFYNIPGGEQTGIKVPIVDGGFMLSMGQTLNVLLSISFNSHEILANKANIVPVVRAEVTSG